MTFRHPLVLALIPLVIAWFIWLKRKRVEAAFIFPSDETIRSFKHSLRAWAAGKTDVLRFAAMALMLIALARPQITDESITRREGIAMELVIDCSSTMLAEDLQLGRFGLEENIKDYAAKKDDKRLNRIDAVKNVAKDFIGAEPDSMIGVVAFAAYAYVVCPTTFDRQWLISSIDRIGVGMIKDATAIGSGILAGVDALSAVKAKSKVIILLTDGNNNYGTIPPLVAARTAKALGIRIYTIGIVSKGQALYPKKDAEGHKTYEYVRIEIDENMLRRVADITGGAYYPVKSLDALKTGYSDIGKLEKTRMDEREREDGRDLFAVFLAWALFALLSDIILSNTYLRKIP